MISSWSDMMAKFRINPGAVARQLLTNLKNHKPLSPTEESRIIDAIENYSGVPNGVDRMLATLSRGAIERLLAEINN
jgi:hypothetical protein